MCVSVYVFYSLNSRMKCQNMLNFFNCECCSLQNEYNFTIITTFIYMYIDTDMYTYTHVCVIVLVLIHECVHCMMYVFIYFFSFAAKEKKSLFLLFWFSNVWQIVYILTFSLFIGSFIWFISFFVLLFNLFFVFIQFVCTVYFCICRLNCQIG